MDEMTRKVDELKDVRAEFAVLSSIIKNPSLIFASEGLTHSHFYDKVNGAIFWAIQKLVTDGAVEIHPIDVVDAIKSSDAKLEKITDVDINDITEIFDGTSLVPERTHEAFNMARKTVQDYALRRTTYQALKKCEGGCFNSDVTNILSTVYDELEKVSRDYAMVKEVKEFKYKVQPLKEKLKRRQNGEIKSISLQIPELDPYVQLEEGELVLVGAEQKVGKSAFLLSASVHLMRQGKRVLIIDSELSDELFYMRMVAHLSGVDFSEVKNGTKDLEKLKKIDRANDEIETFNFYHEYIPVFDNTEIMMLIKRCNAIQRLDVLVIDYFKNSSDGGAFEVSQAMGRTVDMIKNNICGDLKIPGLGAVQMNPDGSVALSKNIARNTSSLITLERKEPEEIRMDGASCGNTRLKVVFNRNGEQHNSEEWIDIQYDGNTLNYHQAKKQHVEQPLADDIDCPY